MAFASIVTKGNGTTIRKVKCPDCTTAYVDKIAGTLDSIIEQERKILEVIVDYEGCVNEHLV